MSDRHWYLFSYDIREPKRWRQVYKIVNGYENVCSIRCSDVT